VKDDRIYLEHIRDAINEISSYTNPHGVNLEIVWGVVDMELRNLRQVIDNLLSAR
jgi:uncharacterized protein with HEPN domain